MLVFAFDRDWTIDVNPHPDRDAVPFKWVRYLAHETEHAVYAIGNQDLTEEAAIPGVVDIVGRHPDEWDEWLGGKRSTGRYERFPDRHERLALIEDLHPEAKEYIVVDDFDLSDVDGWSHYHAWDFVPAVEWGQIHPDLPWVYEPVTDGGQPTTAGISPSDPSALSSFIRDNSDAVGFELTYLDDGVERTQLLHDVSMYAITLERPSAAPAIQCTPVSPTADKFTVALADIEQLSVTEPPRMLYTADADTLDEKATGLRRLAEANPAAVPLQAVFGLLDQQSEILPWEQDALRALKLVAYDRAGECRPVVPILQSLLKAEKITTPADALTILRLIGEEDPADIAPASDVIRQYLDSKNVAVRKEATRCIAMIAERFPEDAIDAVPLLATSIEDEAPGQRHAVYALNQLTSEYPEEVKPVSDRLSEVILDDSLPDGMRLNATAALGRISSEYPDTAVEIVDDVATLVDADNPKLRNNAIGLLADVAKIHADVVEPHVDEIAVLLDTDDDFTRVNASGALSRVAADFPDSVEPYSETFIDLLSDDESLVRTNACWALGHLEVSAAVDPLQERLQDDDGDVRKRADWALHKITGPDLER